MRKAYTIKSGLIAILIYILIIFIAIWAFVENEKEPAKDQEQVIKVDMSNIGPQTNTKTLQADTKKQELSQEKSEPTQTENTPQDKNLNQEKTAKSESKTDDKPKKTEAETKPVEKIAKSQEIISKKKQELNTTIKKPNIIKSQTKETIKPKKDTSSLFDSIDAKAPIIPVKKREPQQKQASSVSASTSNSQPTKKASDMVSGATSSLKSSGVEDGYKSKVKSILNGWPAQSNFAGNKARIKFTIEPSGRFEFDIVNMSSNEEFNKGLIQYLKQLQRVGFGAHGGNRAYVFDVDFIAER